MTSKTAAQIPALAGTVRCDTCRQRIAFAEGMIWSPIAYPIDGSKSSPLHIAHNRAHCGSHAKFEHHYRTKSRRDVTVMWLQFDNFISPGDDAGDVAISIIDWMRMWHVDKGQWTEALLRLTVPLYEDVRGDPLARYMAAAGIGNDERGWCRPEGVAEAHAWALAEGLIDP